MQKYSYKALYVHFVWEEFLSKVLEMWERLEGEIVSGTKSKNGKWNGHLSKKADVVVCQLLGCV